ncbi:MAG: TonB-dependent receptor [Verrucomicrobiales bacterium]|nr:TonB-dependent receptor [Verrucomicrobiales bacterium]
MDSRLNKKSSLFGFAILLIELAHPVFGQPHTETAREIEALKGLSIEQLSAIDITSVSKRSERLIDSPSAIQVISSEDIRRSGASSLAEALRLAPNLQVAQVDSRQWAVSSRGFNSVTADKLLVLIDGRTVYTPLFSGVFWDAQNVMLEDIDRIEVISGPGATLWGANAVNGVINVTTKSARETQGTLVSAGGGSFLKDFTSIRYGDKIGKDVYFRLYGMGFQRDTTLLPNGRDGNNDWSLAQGGFRADWLPPQGEMLTLQGDFYGSEIEQLAPGDSRTDGQNVLSRWAHPIADGSDLIIQTYWDRTWRRIPNVLSDDLNTYDLDVQHRIVLSDRNKLVSGLGYRLMADEVGNSAAIAFLPERRNLQLFGGFVQDETELVEDRLILTLGSKIEHNDYSGFQFQPSIRLAWTPITNQTVWAAVSRAVRSPSRIDADVVAPGVPPYSLQGGGNGFESERLIAYELGYHTQLTRRLGMSIAGFYNDYDDIRSVEFLPGSTTQTIIVNGLRAKTYGAEFSLLWEPIDGWRLRGGYTYFKKRLLDTGSDVNHGTAEGNDPHHQVVLQSMVDLPAHLEFDSLVRYVDNLDEIGPTVPAYISMDLRLGWKPFPHWEFSIVGQNLLDNQHPEFGPLSTRQEIPRSVYGKVTWTF